ncbi:class I lanthipeptide [Chitinophaga flava]|uniref:Class I lanthipeptide n=1 Tax=Chitinophaga flava TaxID=2259036 RepID=A0A365XTV0_9BACT|nr:class I lanthipeptide [Chitinophaga flava]RBL89548.1 hypothetical protein DF182_23860 [Chitinophaga flava]
MKKKKIELNKKLLLRKDKLVTLNPQEQSKLAGGQPITWFSTCCVETDEVTCPIGCVWTR